MSNLRELRDQIIAVTTGDAMDRVDAYVAAREQLAVAAALEQAANIVKVYVGTLGDGPRGVIFGRIRALIPPEGADLLREHDATLLEKMALSFAEPIRSSIRERINYE